MSKAPEGGGDPPPPSYSEATISYPSSSSYNPGSSVSATLQGLSALLRVTQSQQTARDTITTTTLLPLLTPHVTSLLNRLGRTPHPPALTELYLVPAAAVGPQWSITSDADRRAGEVAQVIRVEPEPDLGSKGAGDNKRAVPDAGLSAANSSREHEFDEWGRWDDDAAAAAASTPKEGWWWWNDEALARRLAKLLQPEPRLDRTVVSAVMEQAKEERKAGGWGMFRSGNESPSSSARPLSRQAQPDRSTPPRHEEDVAMTVRAGEVTFRRENEMGIWESMRGYGIVVRVRIRGA